MPAKRVPTDVKMVIEDYKRRIGNRPDLFSVEIQEAMVAQCVMYLMVMRAQFKPDLPMGDYANLYTGACEVLFPNADDD